MIFSPPGKGKDRRADLAEFAGLLKTKPFAERLKLKPPGAPVLCPVVLPSADVIQAAVPMGVRMQGRGRGGGAKAKGNGSRGGGKGGGGKGGGKGSRGVQKKGKA